MVDYWTARQILQKQNVPPNIGSQTDFPSLPQSANNLTPLQRKAPRSTPLRSIVNHPNPAGARSQSDSPNGDVISFSSANFFSFIAKVIKNTLEAYSKNKNVNVEAIIAKSAGSKLGIQAPLPEPTSTASQGPNPTTPMDFASQSPADLPRDEDSHASTSRAAHEESTDNENIQQK